MMDLQPEEIFVKPEINIQIEIEPYENDFPNTLPPEIKTESDEQGDNTNCQSDGKTVEVSYEKQFDNYEELEPVKKQIRTIEIEGKVYENGKINRVQCTECDNTFKNRANLKAHIKFVHSREEDVVECELCFRMFKSVQHLRSHKNSVHVESGAEVPCPHCEKTFPNRKKLSNHVFYCHPSPEEEALCDVCQKTFKTKYRLKVHKKQVHPAGEGAACACGKRFKNAMLLQRHAKWAHPPDGLQYKCQECGRTLPSLEGYRRHVAGVHGAGRWRCACGRRFKSRGSLRRHARRDHPAHPAHLAHPAPRERLPRAPPAAVTPCQHCGKKFATETGLSWHFERFHSENKLDVTCKMCNKDFTDHNNLKRHVETVHSIQSATCTICSKTYKSPMNLQRHIRITHAPPEAAKVCELCNKTFKCSMHLKIHNNVVHSKEGDFSCSVCDKVFSSKKYMVKHAKTHNSKEYPCDLCSKMFKSTNDVKRHVRRVHLKKCVKSERGESVCAKCGVSFEDDGELHSHIISCGGAAERSVKVEVEIVSGEEGGDS